jgi:hypothetical protein
MGRDNVIPRRFFGALDPRTRIPRAAATPHTLEHGVPESVAAFGDTAFTVNT